jgi:hypothetical protein
LSAKPFSQAGSVVMEAAPGFRSQRQELKEMGIDFEGDLVWHEEPFPYLECYVEKDFVYYLFLFTRAAWFVSGQVDQDGVVSVVHEEILPGFTLTSYGEDLIEQRFLNAVRDIESRPEVSRSHYDEIADGFEKVLSAFNFGLISPYVEWEQFGQQLEN